MEKEKRSHPRKIGTRDLYIEASKGSGSYAVSVKDVSRSGAFVRSSSSLPVPGEAICFKIFDEYGLEMTMGQATVMRVVDNSISTVTGFAIQFETELESALLDYLSSVRMDEAI